MTSPVLLAGFATRFTALAIDGAILNGVAVLAGAGLWLAGSVVGLDLHIPDAVAGAVAVIAWLLLLGAYLATFWTLTGQTPGMRAMGIQVISSDGQAVGPHRAIVRVGAMLLAAVPAGAGFLLILVDDRRRGLHDRLAGTLVIHVPSHRARAQAAPSAERAGVLLDDGPVGTTVPGTTG